MSATADDSQPSTSKLPEKRKLHCIIDLTMNRSIGNMSSVEFKRRSILNELNYLRYNEHKTSSRVIFTNPYSINNEAFLSQQPDIIRSMETDPVEGHCLLVSFDHCNVSIFNVSKKVGVFDRIVQLRSTCNGFNNPHSIPHSVHWLWDGSIFTVCTKLALNFWDSCTLKFMESFTFNTQVLNHVIAAKKHSLKKYVAVTGIDGHVYLVDIRHGALTMTMQNVEKSAIRAIQWHPTNELQYATGNDYGNICLWDLRFQKKFVRKINNNNTFAEARSHNQPIIGLNFYNYGNSIISVDFQGCIKSWDVNTGLKYPTHYEPVLLSRMNKLYMKSYHFATTDNLKQDVIFLPSERGLRMFDIDSGEHLPYSNDMSISTNCVTYDGRNRFVYGGCGNVIKVWTPNRATSNIS